MGYNMANSKQLEENIGSTKITIFTNYFYLIFFIYLKDLDATVHEMEL